MDNVTHTLFALTLSRTPLGRAGRATAVALVVASNAPDIDFVGMAVGGMSYLKWHRGPTHGLLGVVGLGVLTAGAVWTGRRLLDRWRKPKTAAADASFATLTAVSMLGVALHILMDLPTTYGVRLLSPFDWHWYALDWIPIVDVYLLVALGIGLLLGRNFEGARRRGTAIVLLFMAANYGVRAAAHRQALATAPQLFGSLLPQTCSGSTGISTLWATWPRVPTEPDDGTGLTGQPNGRSERCLVEIAAMPDFTSPFRWQLIAQMSNAYEIHDIDVLSNRFTQPSVDREAFWRFSRRYPNQWTPAVFQAAATPLGQLFLGFSRFPAARSVVDADGYATVRWTDLRFVGGAARGDQPSMRSNLFTATVRIGPDGSILLQQLGR